MSFETTFIPAILLIVGGFSVPLIKILLSISADGFIALKRYGRKELLIIIPYLMIAFSGILFCETITPTPDRQSMIYLTIAWPMFICAALIRIFLRIRQYNEQMEEHNRKEKEKRRNNLLIDFYDNCIENQIHECRSEKEKQKATLIAQNNKIEFTDIVALFDEAKQCYHKKEKADEEEARQKRLAKMKEKEQSQFNPLNEFASYSKQDKRIAMLTKEYNEVSRELQTINHLIKMSLTPQLEEEHDWAIMGGLANGLAGPGAGIAAAVNAQIENAQIRARNEANWKDSVERRIDFMNAMFEPRKALEEKQAELESKIEKAKIKLIADITPQQCLDMLTVKNTSIAVSETGTCTVDVEVALKQPNYYIFGDVKATIDGTIQAEIFDGNQKIGTANLVLPIDGVPDNHLVGLEGMCLFCGQPEKKYKVKFNADNLWAMEQ